MANPFDDQIKENNVLSDISNLLVTTSLEGIQVNEYNFKNAIFQFMNNLYKDSLGSSMEDVSPEEIQLINSINKIKDISKTTDEIHVKVSRLFAVSRNK